MNLETLRSLMPPPDPDGFDYPWSELDPELAERFPQDLREFIDAYGTGEIHDFMCILNPFSNHRGLNVTDAKRFEEDYVGFYTNNKEIYEERGLPEPGSFFNWGFTIDDDRFIGMLGQDNQFVKVGIVSYKLSEVEYFDCTCIEFITGLLTGEIDSSILPPDIASQSSSFESIKE